MNECAAKLSLSPLSHPPPLRHSLSRSPLYVIDAVCWNLDAATVGRNESRAGIADCRQSDSPARGSAAARLTTGFVQTEKTNNYCKHSFYCCSNRNDLQTVCPLLSLNT